MGSVLKRLVWSRLQELTDEVTPQGEAHLIPLMEKAQRGGTQLRPKHSLDGYKAPLIARVHTRLGMWQWTIMAEVIILPY